MQTVSHAVRRTAVLLTLTGTLLLLLSSPAVQAARERGQFVGRVESVTADGAIQLKLSPAAELSPGDQLLIGRSLVSSPHGELTVRTVDGAALAAGEAGVEVKPGYIVWQRATAKAEPAPSFDPLGVLAPAEPAETTEPTEPAELAEPNQPAEPAESTAAEMGGLERLIGRKIDIQTHRGTVYRQATLIGVRRKGGEGSEVHSIQIVDQSTNEDRSLAFAAIRRMAYDGKMIHTAGEPMRPERGEPADAANEPDAPDEEQVATANPETEPESEPESKPRRKKKGERPQMTEEQWLTLAEARGVRPWPELSPEAHAATIAENRELMARVSKALPGMREYETEHFMLLSNIPEVQFRPYIAQLDAMHVELVEIFGLPEGFKVWRGKALIIAFISREQFLQFEKHFMDHVPPPGTYGLCHQRSDGPVTMACYRGDNRHDFGQMLIHETSHGFVHRYLSSARLPAWLNEGLAEWIGERMVPASTQVDLKVARAKRRLAERGTFDGMFQAQQPELWHYGAGASMADFLIKTDSYHFANLMRLIKAGMSFEEALAQTYGGTLAEFVAAYGRSIGLPGLRP